MSPRHFVLAFVGLSALLAATAAGFNAWVNPYLLFDTPRVAGFNAKKPAVETRERLMKSYEALRRPARTLIIGSSRTDLGLDPASAAWPERLRPVYNLSLVGSGPETGVRFAQHLLAGEPAKAAAADTLIVGLDFESFLFGATAPAAPSAAAQEVEARLLVLADGRANPQRRQQLLLDHVAGLLSLDALIDSVQTVRANRGGAQPDIEPNGHLSEGRFEQWVQADGFARLFEQKNVQAVQALAKPHRQLGGVVGAPLSMPFKLQTLINFAAQRQMKLLLAIQPSHASRLDLLDHLGYWSAYEQWKRAVTQEVAVARQGGQDVSVWDFGGYEAPMLEKVPAPGDRRARMRWFWDPVHYSAALGEQMVAAMLGEGALATEPVGVLLTPQNLEARLAQVRADRQRYRVEQAAASAATRQLYCRFSRAC
ncbi:hypothetical protein RQP53_16525 [Paucibacter sp. APW11]|uniref:AlgX/AlgJ SGNH hydrolase-like domain-containing protein n=1 Tax=Roseateles aquae TaxID=3077235 RepID=A0ABU3PFL7_9BURK|nr:hypothetical protein [Paucibacter sp. APW11]MDT9000883.1 hypothetical protein [Paucibacter sp. APW11]